MSGIRDNFGAGPCAHCGGSGQVWDARIGDAECPECDGCGHFGDDGEPIKSETFWLIERGPNQGQPNHQWWSDEHARRGSDPGWRDSVHEATKFPSKDAAERFTRTYWRIPHELIGFAITSHGFVVAKSTPPGDADSRQGGQS